MLNKFLVCYLTPDSMSNQIKLKYSIVTFQVISKVHIFCGLLRICELYHQNKFVKLDEVDEAYKDDNPMLLNSPKLL